VFARCALRVHGNAEIKARRAIKPSADDRKKEKEERKQGIVSWCW
jgi:hypothetical protein